MGTPKAKVVAPQKLTTKNLTAQHYVGTITCECVGGVFGKHRKDFAPAELADGPPICMEQNCGMPMLPVKAAAKLATVTLDTLDPKQAPAIAREVAKQKKKPAKRRR